jgi:hypothetical protein
MGHSKSKVVQEVINNTLNASISSSITSNSQESSVETLVESANSCSSSVDQSNSCNMSNMSVGGDLVIGGTQSNKGSVNFSCVSSSEAAQAMESAATSAIAGELDALNGTEAAAVLNAKAAAATKSGFASSGGSASSDVSSTNKNTVSNITKSNIENIFKSHLSQNLTSKTVDECIGRTVQKNELNVSGTKVGGNAKIECNQSNSLEQVQECKQLSSAIQGSFNKTAQELGFKVKTESTTSSKTKMEGSATSESVATGPIQDLGNAVSGIIGSVGNLFGLASLGVAGPFIVYSCCIVCCIILSCVSVMFVAKSGGDSGGTGGPSFSMPTKFPKMGKMGRRGGGFSNSETDSSDIIEYLGAVGIDMVSDIISDSSPLFD